MSEKRCPSCGAVVDVSARECKYCGEALIVNEDVARSSDNTQKQDLPHQYNEMKNEYQNNNSSNDYINNVYSHMKPYYQHEFNRMRDSNGAYKGKWNWCAFFFSWIWAFTKGLWGPALAILLIDGIGVGMNISFIGFILSIYCGIRGNYLYYNLITNNTQFPKKL